MSRTDLQKALVACSDDQPDERRRFVNAVLEALCPSERAIDPTMVAADGRAEQLREACRLWESQQNVMIQYVGVAYWDRGHHPNVFRIRGHEADSKQATVWKRLRRKIERHFPDAVLERLVSRETAVVVEWDGGDTLLYAEDRVFRVPLPDLTAGRVHFDDTEAACQLAETVQKELLQTEQLKTAAKGLASQTVELDFNKIADALAVVGSFFPAIGVRALYSFPSRFQVAASPVFLTVGTTDRLHPDEVAAFRHLALHMLHLPAVTGRLSNARYREMSEWFRPLMEAAGRAVKRQLDQRPRDEPHRLDSAEHESLWQDCFQHLFVAFGQPALPTVPGGRFIPPTYAQGRYQQCLRAFNTACPEQLGLQWVMANYWSPARRRIVSANIHPERDLDRWRRAWNLFLALTEMNTDEAVPAQDRLPFTTLNKFLVQLHSSDGEVPPPVEWRIGFTDQWHTVCRAVGRSNGTPDDDHAQIVSALRDELCPFDFVDVPAAVVHHIYGTAVSGGESFGKWLKGYLGDPNRTHLAKGDTDTLIRYWTAIQNNPAPDICTFARYLAAYLRHHHPRADDPLVAATSANPPAATDQALFLLFSHLILSTDWLLDDTGGVRLRDGDPATRQCVYMLPSWTQQLSILTVVSATVLEPWEYYHLRTIADRLFTTAWTLDSDRKHSLEEDRIREEARRAASAAIIARNGSHNIGSHVLANVQAAECQARPQDVKMLLSYIQQRMDFVASVMAPWPDWREPVFFFADLLSGLLDQGLLWDKLVADEGYRAGRIDFEVTWAGRLRTWKYKLEKNQRTRLFSRFVPVVTPDPPTDFLVGIAGGVMGRQAFYGLMENLVRNSAKHNRTSKSRRLVITLEVHQPPGAAVATITYRDNVSAVKAGQINHIRRALAADVIDKDGKAVTENWGIQEMKVYARYLTAGLQTAAEAPPLRAERQPRPGGKKKYLEYRWDLPLATTILFAADPPVGDARGTQEAGIAFHPPLDPDGFRRKIVALSPLLIVIPPAVADDPDRVGEIDALFDRKRRGLPPRVLMLTTRKPSDHPATVAAQVAVQTVEADRAYPPADGKAAAWQEVVAELYSRWVQGMSGASAGVDLLLLIDRQAAREPNPDEVSPGLPAWSRLRRELPNFGIRPEQFGVRLFRTVDRKAEGFDPEHDASATDEKSRVVFDNHRRLESSAALAAAGAARPAFYQVIGHEDTTGVNNASLFNHVTNVPDGLGGALFYLKLVESAFARVLLIDERAAAAVTFVPPDGHPRLNEYYRALYAARVFVGLSTHSAVERPARSWLVKRLAPSRTGTSRLEHESDDADQQEGIHLTGAEAKRIAIAVPWVDGKSDEARDARDARFDVIVVHLGWLETRWPDNDTRTKFLHSLTQFAPRVVLTSGRGQTGNALLTNFPFVSYSTIESYVLRELSKYHLTNPLLSVSSGAAP